MSITGFFSSISNLPGFTVFWGAATFLLGAAVGNYLAINRDKRKEWNEIARQIREPLDVELITPFPDSDRPKIADLNRFEHMLTARKRLSYRQAVKRYQDAHEEHTHLPKYDFPCFQYEYKSVVHIEKAIHDLLSFMSYR